MAYPNQLLDGSNIPIGQVWVPGDTTFSGLEGSLSTNTDGSTNKTAPATFHHAARTVYLKASAAVTTSGNSGTLIVGPFAELAIDVNVTVVTGTTVTIQFIYARFGADGILYDLWTPSTVNAVSKTSTSIGSGFAINQSFGSTGQLRWVVAGTTPSFTLSVSIVGK